MRGAIMPVTAPAQKANRRVFIDSDNPSSERKVLISIHFFKELTLKLFSHFLSFDLFMLAETHLKSSNICFSYNVVVYIMKWAFGNAVVTQLPTMQGHEVVSQS